MARRDPRQLVVEHLCAPAAPGEPPFTTVPDSITFVRAETSPQRCGFVVTFQDSEGQALYVVEVGRRPDDSWAIAGMGGGTDVAPSRGHPAPPRRGPGPWLNLAGGWAAHWFCMGGRVLGRGAEHAQVAELVTEVGVYRDALVEGVALFLVHEPIPVATAAVRLLDGTGGRLAEHPIL